MPTLKKGTGHRYNSVTHSHDYKAWFIHISILKTNAQDADDVAATVNYEAMKKDPAVREAAVRFAQDHLGYETIDPDDAISEFIEHFRSFNINELTAGMDYNIVSGLATDAASTTNKDNARKAQQRLDDYTKLYQTYQALPGAFDAGGAPGAFLDYLEGIAKAPSTYIGIVPASLQVVQPQH